MVRVRIRRFVKGDEETYVKVHNEGFSTEEWWGITQKPLTIDAARKLDHDATFFAEIQGRAIGIVDVKIRSDEAHIENLCVLPNFRRIGVGTKLIEKVTDFSRSRGAKRIRAETPAQGASAFYERNGFRLAKYAFFVRLQDVVETLGESLVYVSTEGDLTHMRQHGIHYEMMVKLKVMTKELLAEHSQDNCLYNDGRRCRQMRKRSESSIDVIRH